MPSPKLDPSDAELVERCQQGQAAAFDQLVLRYQRRVIGLCLRHLRSYEDACDLAQEVFVQVFQHLGDFKGRSSFSTWLYRVALNACYNKQRWWAAKGRNTVSSLDGLLESDQGRSDSSPLLRDKDPGALKSMERDEDLAQLRQALDGLDEEQRQVVELVDIEELRYEEAAQVLQVPVNTVRSRLNRARQQLKLRLVRLRKRLGEGPEGRP